MRSTTEIRARTATTDLNLKARIDEILNCQPAVDLRCHGRLEFFSGHGFAEIASDTPIT